MFNSMLRKSPEVIAQKHVKINTKKKTAKMNPHKHVKANAQKKLLGRMLKNMLR
jgi:hypothetical protein